MRLIGQARVLNVYIGEADTYDGQPLHEAITKRARQLGIKGATVFRAIGGYGTHRSVHKHSALALWSDDPILISVIDTPENVDRLVAAVDSMVSAGCLLTIHDVSAVQYVENAPARAGERR